MRELLHDGGTILVTIVAFSLLAWAIAVSKWLQLRAEQPGGLRWMDEALAHLARRDRARARDLCERHPGIAARVLHEAIRTAEPRRRFFEVHLAPVVRGEQARLRGQLALVAVIAGLCPLLGLLGTVLGMMTTFDGVTLWGTVEPDKLAHGVSRALVTTQAGLVMAMPLLLVHGYLRSRIDRLLEAIDLRVRKVETLVCRD